MHVLVLGAYGLIGLEISQALLAAGHRITGLARSASHGRRVLPEATWIGADLGELTDRASWQQHLTGVDAVVNASGALQTGARDTLETAQFEAIRALVQACESQNISKFIQISAPDARPDSNTEFLATKAKADAALKASTLDWTVLRPGLVIAPTAYGGTSLLRMLAAVPLVQPLLHADAPIQSVHVGDVAKAVVQALADERFSHGDFDLVEEQVHTLEHIVLSFRRWLGFAPAPVIRVPALFGGIVAMAADAAGWLGWRAPLRSTAMKVLTSGVTGDPAHWKAQTGQTLLSLDETLNSIPSTRQERLYARVKLVFPILLVLLSAFWLASGFIGLWQREAAAGLISPLVGQQAAYASVYAGVVADLAVGLGLLVHRTSRFACFGAIAVSLGYLALGTWLTPHLWADPLGVLVKVFPGIGLALVLAVMAEER